MGGARRRLFALLSLVLSVAVLAALLELGLRFLPVTSGRLSQETTREDPVFRFRPNRDIVHSLEWNLAHASRRHVNNAGFVSDLDYTTDDERPVLAVIGDSYVESLIIAWDATLQAHLSARAGERGRVYSFAASGAPLSQYLIWAQHARARYDARFGVIVVVANDFDESLAYVKLVPGFHHFVDPDGELELRLFEHHPNVLREPLEHSALGRYLFLNLRMLAIRELIKTRLNSLLRSRPDRPQYVGNTAAEASPERLAYSQRVVAEFFEELPARTGWAPRDVVFVLDGIRPFLYDDEALEAVSDSYFARMRRHFSATARRLGYEVIDMQPIFRERHRADGTVFEFADNQHWNERAHALVAQAIADSSVFQRFLSQAEPGR